MYWYLLYQSMSYDYTIYSMAQQVQSNIVKTPTFCIAMTMMYITYQYEGLAWRVSCQQNEC